VDVLARLRICYDPKSTVNNSDVKRDSILRLHLPIWGVETTTAIQRSRRASLQPPHTHLLDHAFPLLQAGHSPFSIVLTPSHWEWA
jgi:hypothetical protein